MEQKNRRISTRQLVSMAMLGAISIVPGGSDTFSADSCGGISGI